MAALARNTLIRRILAQLGEAGYYVRQPALGARYLDVAMVDANITVRGVALALDSTVQGQVEIVDYNATHPLTPGQRYNVVRVYLY